MQAVGIVTCAIASALLASPADAVCFMRDFSKPGGWDLTRSSPARTFSVDDEFGRAFIVATVRVVSGRELREDKADPEGLTAHAYRVRPLDTLKGPVLSEFTLHNSNSSARFDMNVGGTYLVFVSTLAGRSVIDNCGWSDATPAATEALSKVRDIAATTRPPSSP